MPYVRCEMHGYAMRVMQCNAINTVTLPHEYYTIQCPTMHAAYESN